MPEHGIADHGGALLAALLAEHGVRHVFGVPGGQTLARYDGMAGGPIRHVLTRDERSAAYAADGYARVTGQAGVCDATVGPGAAKLPSGLGESLGASVPVVALVSDLPARLAPHRYRSAASQALDQAALLAPVTKWQATVPDAATMPALVRQAFRAATSGRPGPVVLFLPQDVLDGPAPAAGSAPGTSARFGQYPPFRPAPEPADVAAAAAALSAAERPFILAGGGVLHAGAATALTALAERLSAAVGTTLSGKGAIAEDHPLSVGVTGSMGTSAAAAALAEADVVLLAGCKAATARPTRRTVVLAGDGALGYAVGELATVAQYRRPVTVIVLNNRSLGWIRWYRRVTFGRGWQDDDFADVAFAEVARGFGWPAARVSEPGQLAAVLVDICGGLGAAGARHILVVNWHEGNSATLRLGADEAQRRHGVQVVIAEAHVITHTRFPDEMEFTHRGAMETAAVPAYEPGLVHLDQTTEPSDQAAGEVAHALFRHPDVYPVLRDFHQIAPTGWYGRPDRASAGRADEIAEAVADHVVSRARAIWAALEEAK